MQLGLESSYEVHHTVVIHPNLVYDILASGTPSKGDYVILTRTINNQTDTVARGAREGRVVNAFTADLDKDQNPEIYMALQSTDSSKRGTVMGWKFGTKGKAISIQFECPGEDYNHYRGFDSIYTEIHSIPNSARIEKVKAGVTNEEVLVVGFPIFKASDALCCPSGGTAKHYYRLSPDNKLNNSGFSMPDESMHLILDLTPKGKSKQKPPKYKVPESQ